MLKIKPWVFSAVVTVATLAPAAAASAGLRANHNETLLLDG